MMMGSFAILAGLISLVQVLAHVALLYVLYRKAGLQGGVMLACFLPFAAMLSNMAVPLLLTSVIGTSGEADAYIYLLTNSVFGVLCYLGPLLVLAVAKWPVLVTRTGDLFK